MARIEGEVIGDELQDNFFDDPELSEEEEGEYREDAVPEAPALMVASGATAPYFFAASTSSLPPPPAVIPAPTITNSIGQVFASSALAESTGSAVPDSHVDMASHSSPPLRPPPPPSIIPAAVPIDTRDTQPELPAQGSSNEPPASATAAARKPLAPPITALRQEAQGHGLGLSIPVDRNHSSSSLSSLASSSSSKVASRHGAAPPPQNIDRSLSPLSDLTSLSSLAGTPSLGGPSQALVHPRRMSRSLASTSLRRASVGQFWIEPPVLAPEVRARYSVVEELLSPKPKPAAPTLQLGNGRTARTAKLMAMAEQRRQSAAEEARRKQQRRGRYFEDEDDDADDIQYGGMLRRSRRPKRQRRLGYYEHDEDDFEELPSEERERASGSKRQGTRGGRGRREQDTDNEYSDRGSDELEISSEDELDIDSDDSEAHQSDGDWASSSRRRRRSGRNKSGRRRNRRTSDASDDANDDGDEPTSRVPLMAKHCPNCYKCGQKAAVIAMKKLASRAARLKVSFDTAAAGAAGAANANQTRRGTASRAQAGPVNYAEGPVEDTPTQRLLEEKAALDSKGGWIECRTCVAAFHFDCLPPKRKKEILQELNKVAREEYQASIGASGQPEGDLQVDQMIKDTSRIPTPPFEPLEVLPIERTLVIEQCTECAERQNACLVCKETTPAQPAGNDQQPHSAQQSGAKAHPDASAADAAPSAEGRTDDTGTAEPAVRVKTEHVEDEDISFVGLKAAKVSSRSSAPKESLVFRCQRCHRFVHYRCLSLPTPGTSLEEKARIHQGQDWKCDECSIWGWVDIILAWRPDKTVTDPARIKLAQTTPLNADVKSSLPREYLVKLENRPYRDAVWVPHSWLSITSKQKLKNFLTAGSKVELEPSPNASLDSLMGSGHAPPSARQSVLDRSRVLEEEERPPLAELDADRRLPREYLTPDRVIDAYYWPNDRSVRRFGLPPLRDKWGNVKSIKDAKAELKGSALKHIKDMKESDDRNGLYFTLGNAAILLVKWQDLTYEHCTWEPVPDREKDTDFYDKLGGLLNDFLRSRKVYVPERKRNAKAPDLKDGKMRLKSQPTYIKGGELLPFQLKGVNWLRSGWYTRCPGILADDMGLGKTIQVISFIGTLIHENQRSPHLIIAPNSTVANWAREFQKWLPATRVVTVLGEHESTNVIEEFELYHDNNVPGRSPLRAHVVIMSEPLARRDGLKLLKQCAFWETLVVDEGQSLKAGEGNILYRKLQAVEAGHRVLLSGTPLNNNLGELFNLLNWLQPDDKWADVRSLQKRYESLNPQLVSELQEMLRPHFLRRTKDEVLQLPPKTEFIVPVSLRPIQKRMYKSLLEQNLEDINSLTGSAKSKGGPKLRTSMNNILMQLRKCVQHPYLVKPDLENAEDGESLEMAQQRLVNASGKLMLLQRLLRKLKERGHRVLLFSQFVISLDIVEQFLRNEGHRYLRLDGSTNAKVRQKAIDAYNEQDSPYFIFLLSTRAGGVGINLATADTVIILDPDFNPHLDMQAVARAHRFGQTKNTLVFTLVCKNTAEERIIESAKRKRILDHVIVENLDKDDIEATDLESILKHGAKSLFDEGGLEENERDIKHSDADIDNLILQGETAERAPPQEGSNLGQFSFAQVWEHAADATASPEKGSGQEEISSEQDFWDDLLKQQQEAALKNQQQAASLDSGRGVRRKAAQYNFGPASKRARRKGPQDDEQDSESDDYLSPPPDEDMHDDSDADEAGDSPQAGAVPRKTKRKRRPAPLVANGLVQNINPPSVVVDGLPLPLIPNPGPNAFAPSPNFQHAHQHYQHPAAGSFGLYQGGPTPQITGPAASNAMQMANGFTHHPPLPVHTPATEVMLQSMGLHHGASTSHQRTTAMHEQRQVPMTGNSSQTQPSLADGPLVGSQGTIPAPEGTNTAMACISSFEAGAPSTVPLQAAAAPTPITSGTSHTDIQAGVTPNMPPSEKPSDAPKERATISTAAMQQSQFLTLLHQNQARQYERNKLEQQQAKERAQAEAEAKEQSTTSQTTRNVPTEPPATTTQAASSTGNQPQVPPDLFRTIHELSVKVQAARTMYSNAQQHATRNPQDARVQAQLVQLKSNINHMQRSLVYYLQQYNAHQASANAAAAPHAPAPQGAAASTEITAQAQTQTMAPPQPQANTSTSGPAETVAQVAASSNPAAALTDAQRQPQPQPASAQDYPSNQVHLPTQTQGHAQDVAVSQIHGQAQSQVAHGLRDGASPGVARQMPVQAQSQSQSQVIQFGHQSDSQSAMSNEGLPLPGSQSGSQQMARRRANPIPPPNHYKRSSSGSIPHPNAAMPQSPDARRPAAAVQDIAVIQHDVSTQHTLNTLARWNRLRSELPASTVSELEERMKSRGVPAPNVLGDRPPLTHGQAMYYAALFHLPVRAFSEAFTIIERSLLDPKFLQLPNDGAGLLDGLQIKDKIMNALFVIIYTLTTLEFGNRATLAMNGGPVSGSGSRAVSQQRLATNLSQHQAGRDFRAVSVNSAVSATAPVQSPTFPQSASFAQRAQYQQHSTPPSSDPNSPATQHLSASTSSNQNVANFPHPPLATQANTAFPSVLQGRLSHFAQAPTQTQQLQGHLPLNGQGPNLQAQAQGQGQAQSQAQAQAQAQAAQVQAAQAQAQAQAQPNAAAQLQMQQMINTFHRQQQPQQQEEQQMQPQHQISQHRNPSGQFDAFNPSPTSAAISTFRGLNGSASTNQTQQ